jgi:hypothetical protein
MKDSLRFRVDETPPDLPPRPEADARNGQTGAGPATLRRRRRRSAGIPLLRTGPVAPPRRARVSTTDGPFAETKEQLGGSHAWGPAPESAEHAREHAACTRAETIALLDRGAAAAAAVIRGLDDDQLSRRAVVVAELPPMSVEELIAAGLLGHTDEHFGSIRKTIGHP